MNEKVYYIGVASQKQMGKDTLSDFIQSRFLSDVNLNVKFERSAFAKNVKRIFSDAFNVDDAFIEKWKVIPEPPPGFDAPVREGLTMIGDGFRKIQSRIWIDMVFRGNQNKIISDVRYPNEVIRISSEQGFNILVGRPDRINNDASESEAALKPSILWCLEHMPQGGDPRTVDGKNKPELLKFFNYFVPNAGSIEDYYKFIDTNLLPVLYNYIQER